MSEAIVVEVTREVCGHNSRVAGCRIVEGPPHVKRFISQSSLAACTLSLVKHGYDFSVRTVAVEVSILEWSAGCRS